MKQFLSFLHTHVPQIGLATIVTGILLLAIGFIYTWTAHNGYTLFALFLIIGGVVGYVAGIKRQSRY